MYRFIPDEIGKLGMLDHVQAFPEGIELGSVRYLAPHANRERILANLRARHHYSDQTQKARARSTAL